MIEETELCVSLEEAQNSLTHWLSQVRDLPLVITEQGTAVGVLISPATYARLRRIQAYFELLRLSHSLQESGMTAKELFQLAREEAEVRM